MTGGTTDHAEQVGALLVGSTLSSEKHERTQNLVIERRDRDGQKSHLLDGVALGALGLEDLGTLGRVTLGHNKALLDFGSRHDGGRQAQMQMQTRSFELCEDDPEDVFCARRSHIVLEFRLGI